MVEYNDQDIISYLLLNGYEKVPFALFDEVKEKIHEKYDGLFKYKSVPFMNGFSKIVVKKDGFYRLNDGYTLDTNIIKLKDKLFKVKDYLDIEISSGFKFVINELNNA